MDLEHTFRFLKQTLGWITPRVRHPEQADRWTWLVVAAFAQLRLARTCVADRRLPWERRYDTGRLTPVRVRRVVFGAFGGTRHARQAAETLWEIARKTERPPLGSSQTLSGDQKERLSLRRQQTRSFAMSFISIAKLLVVKTQA